MTNSTTHAIKITIEPASIGQRGQRYRVFHEGCVLLVSTREPLFDACRALLAQGVTGRLQMWRPGKAHHDMAVDIEAGARLAVIETASRGPVFGPWQPWEEETEEHAFPVQASAQGRPSRDLEVKRCPGNKRPSTARSAA